MSRKNWGFVDFRLKLSGLAWQVLHAIDGEPSFAPWDEAKGEYKLDCETTAFYNGRERGFCLKVAHEERFARGGFLYVCFAENRSSDDIVVYSWIGRHMINPPTGTDITDATYKRAKYFKAVDAAVEHIRGLMKDYLAGEEHIAVVEEVLTS